MPEPEDDDAMPLEVNTTSPDNSEDERWRGHQRAHARDQEVADKAAKDVKEALDKAAIEVTGRLTEVRAYIDQVLKSHADLHGADREALLLARGVLEKELNEINNVRAQLAGDRALLPTGDVVRSLISASKAEIVALQTSQNAEQKATMSQHITDERTATTAIAKTADAQELRIRALETTGANLNGRLAAFGVAFLFLVGLLEFVLKGVKIG